jgi:hypothetical protein
VLGGQVLEYRIEAGAALVYPFPVALYKGKPEIIVNSASQISMK